MGRISSGSASAPQGGGVGRISQAVQQQPINFIQQYEQQLKVKDIQNIFANPNKFSVSQQYRAATDAEKLGLLNREDRIKAFEDISTRNLASIKEMNKAPAWQQAIVDVTKGIGQDFAAPFQLVGAGYGEVLGQITGVSDKERRVQQEAQKQSLNLIRELNRQIASPQTSALQKERARQAISKISGISSEQAQQFAQGQAQIAERANVPKALGAIGQIGLDVITAGTAGPALKGLRGLTAAQKAVQIGKVGAVTTPIGAAYGATSTLQEKGTAATPEDYLKSMAIGGGIGLGLGLIAPPLLEIANRALRKAGTSIEEVVTRVATKQPAAEAGRITGAVERAATPTRIPVTTVESPAVVLQRTSDAVFTRELSNISKQYDAEIAKIEKITNPIAQQAAARQLETKYETLVNNLTDNYTSGKLTPAIPPERVVPGITPTPAITTIPSPTPVKAAISGQVPYSVTMAGEQKVAGGALKAEQRAVENKLNAQLGDLATYNVISFKEEAKLATELLKNDRQRAIDISLGKVPARNDAQRAAITAALETDLLKGSVKPEDINLIRQMASSNRYTRTSEAAQTLAAEGYFIDSTSPTSIITDIVKTREKVLATKTKQSVNKLIAKEKENINKSIKAPSKNDWINFIEELRCK